MFFRVRQCCCSLVTFVKVTNILSTVIYFCVALASVLWFLLFSSNQFGGNKDEDADDVTGSQTNLIVLIVSMVFVLVGVIVNLLSLWALKAKKRSLILPWLVFHAVLTTGCFALGLYLALWFTVFYPKPDPNDDDDDGGNQQQRSNNQGGNHEAMAVLALFPIVGGIFLIFLWLFVDQQFIQMGRQKIALKELKLSIAGSMHSIPSHGILKTKSKSHSNLNHVNSGHSLSGTAPNTPAPQYHSKSLPRPTNKVKRHSSLTPGAQHQQQQMMMTSSPRFTPNGRPNRAVAAKSSASSAATNIYRNGRSRSLENILDSNSSSCASSAAATRQHNNNSPNYWVQGGTGLKSRAPIPKPPRKSLTKHDEVIIHSVEPVRKQRVNPLPAKYYHTMTSRHPAIRRVNSVDSFTSMSELSAAPSAADRNNVVVGRRPMVSGPILASTGSVRNLTQPSPSWRRKPERFYNAYGDAAGGPGNNSVMPNLPPKKAIHQRRDGNNSFSSGAALPQHAPTGVAPPPHAPAGAPLAAYTENGLESDIRFMRQSSISRGHQPVSPEFPPPPSYFYDDDDEEEEEEDPKSMHVTIAYLNATQSSAGAVEEDYQGANDFMDGAGLPPDPYQTLRSNISVKSVKIAPEVTEFHYTSQDPESPVPAATSAVNSFGNDYRMTDQRQLPMESSWLPNPVYPTHQPTLNTSSNRDVIDTTSSHNNNSKKTSVQNWLAKMASSSSSNSTNSSSDHQQRRNNDVIEPEVFGTVGDVQL